MARGNKKKKSIERKQFSTHLRKVQRNYYAAFLQKV